MSTMFNLKLFLKTNGKGRALVPFAKGRTIYSQDDAANAVFVIQKGTAKLSVKSLSGRRATYDVLGAGDFVGTDAIGGHSLRTSSAIAMTDCTVLQIDKKEMLLALRQQPELAAMFWKYLLTATILYQQDLVDHHCNRSEKRLARVLLKLADFDNREHQTVTQRISQQTLAEMVGTTRSRVSFFMKRFSESGLIHYEHKGKLLQVNRSLVGFCARPQK